MDSERLCEEIIFPSRRGIDGCITYLPVRSEHITRCSLATGTFRTVSLLAHCLAPELPNAILEVNRDFRERTTSRGTRRNKLRMNARKTLKASWLLG